MRGELKDLWLIMKYWFLVLVLVCVCGVLVIAPDLALEYFDIDLGFSLKWASGAALGLAIVCYYQKESKAQELKSEQEKQENTTAPVWRKPKAMKLSEFDFRVWNGEKYVYPATEEDSVYGVINFITPLEVESFEKAENCEVELYSGELDRQGVGIYVGDILRVIKKGKALTGVVCYENYAWSLDFGEKYKSDFKELLYLHFTQEHFEVIGNIHENPELLKSQGGRK